MDTRINLFDKTGKIVGQKAKSDIHRTKDILPSVYIFVINNDKKMLLAEIDQHPNNDRLYIGRIGLPAATYIQTDEDHEKAAHRALQSDLGIINPNCKYLGTYFENFDGEVKRHASVYYCTHPKNPTPNKNAFLDLQHFSRTDIEREIALNEENFAPSFLALWNRHNRQLPI